MKTTNTTKLLMITCILLVLPCAGLLAQSGLGGDPGGAPIDGGISLLVAAGIGYGAKKARDARKKVKQAKEDNDL